MAATEDLFTAIHTGLRSMLSNLNGRIQTHDFADVAATRTLVTDLEYDFETARSAGCALCIMNVHATSEESVIFGEVGKAGNLLIPTLIQEHHDLTHREHAIAAAANEILKIPDAPARIAAGIRLNRSTNELVAAYLAHMNKEDAELVPWMREHFTDPQMAAMRGTIMAHWPPDRLFAVLGWMLPSLNRQELVDLTRAMQHALPPPAFKGITDLAAAKVDPGRWGAVRAEVGL